MWKAGIELSIWSLGGTQRLRKERLVGEFERLSDAMAFIAYAKPHMALDEIPQLEKAAIKRIRS